MRTVAQEEITQRLGVFRIVQGQLDVLHDETIDRCGSMQSGNQYQLPPEVEKYEQLARNVRMSDQARGAERCATSPNIPHPIGPQRA